MGIINTEDGILKLDKPDTEKDLLIDFSACPNPYCDCGDVLLTIPKTKTDGSAKSKMVLELNIRQVQIRLLDGLSEKWYDEHESNKLKSYLDNNLTEGDWHKLEYEYYYKKYLLTEIENENHNFNYEFSDEQMNDESLQISFDTIYPASQTFSIEKEDIGYDLIDQYCKNPKCNCTDINIHVFKDGEYQFDFFYNYKTKKTEDSKYDWVIEKLNAKYKDLKFRFKIRNAKIRLLYSEKLLEQSKSKLDYMKSLPPSSPQVGRNDKCPCGSGKKYKQCCMNKLDL